MPGTPCINKNLPCEKWVSSIFEIVPELLVQLLGNCFRGISLRAPATQIHQVRKCCWTAAWWIRIRLFTLMRIRFGLSTSKDPDPVFYETGFTDPHGSSVGFHSSRMSIWGPAFHFDVDPVPAFHCGSGSDFIH